MLDDTCKDILFVVNELNTNKKKLEINYEYFFIQMSFKQAILTNINKMNINLEDIDTTSFNIKKVNIIDEECSLITPKIIGAKWNATNLHFRSSLWNSEGQLISASFPKFFNMNEHNELLQFPTDLDGCCAIEKMDGSTLIVSKYKGELIIRTRGSGNASHMNNSFEIEIFKEKYPKVFDFGDVETSNNSRIFEWLSPINRIVIKHDECDIKLISIINHEDYSLKIQSELDEIGVELCVPRPQTYCFNDIKSMILCIKELKNSEGICLYSNNGQTIHKIKADEYLAKHRLKTSLNSFDKVVDYYFVQGFPEEILFYNSIKCDFDFETAQELLPNIKIICANMEQTVNILKDITNFIETLKDKKRNVSANIIKEKYQKMNLCGHAFNILDNRPITNTMRKNVFYQNLKNNKVSILN
jgi:hypothetical protein